MDAVLGFFGSGGNIRLVELVWLEECWFRSWNWETDSECRGWSRPKIFSIPAWKNWSPALHDLFENVPNVQFQIIQVFSFEFRQIKKRIISKGKKKKKKKKKKKNSWTYVLHCRGPGFDLWLKEFHSLWRIGPALQTWRRELPRRTQKFGPIVILYSAQLHDSLLELVPSEPSKMTYLEPPWRIR